MRIHESIANDKEPLNSGCVYYITLGVSVNSLESGCDVEQ